MSFPKLVFSDEATTSMASVTDEQWAEAKRLFEQQIQKGQCGTLTKEKYDTILEILSD